VIGQPISGKPVIGLQDLKGRNLPHFGPYAKERANIIASMKQVILLQFFFLQILTSVYLERIGLSDFNGKF
jgi:hypothetical protein